MKIAFRTDASFLIGIGHLMRCLTLAGALQSKGAEVHFLCRDLPGFDQEHITSPGHTLHLLPYPIHQTNHIATLHNPPHEHWLPCSQKQESQECIKILETLPLFDWIVVDHYALDQQWENQITHFSKQLMVIDDLADRLHNCDLLLDQNYIADAIHRYRGLLPFECKPLLGPKYALLRQQFSDAGKKDRHRYGTVQRIFIFFGGTDPTNETGKALTAIDMLGKPEIAVDVVVGSANPHKDELMEKIADRPRITLHKNVENMARLMARADLAIGAGGTTSWERCCLGLPCLIEILADNQKAIAEGIDQIGAGWNLGLAEQVSAEDILKSIEKILASKNTLKRCSQRASQLVDGKGTEKIVRIMETGSITLRECHDTDCERLWYWGNDPTVRQSAFKTDDISWEEHLRWFTAKRHDADAFLFIAENSQGTPVGQIRFDLDLPNNIAEIDYLIAKQFLDLKIDRILLKKGIKELINHISAPMTFQKKPQQKNLISPQYPPAPLTKNKKITIAIVSDFHSWINPYLTDLIGRLIDQAKYIRWTHKIEDLEDEDIVFYLSCGQITTLETLKRHKHNLIVHESDLPHGRGWSPLTWQIIEGKTNIPITLFEAAEQIDRGPVYLQENMSFQGHELINELREKQAIYTIQLCMDFINQLPGVVNKAKTQRGKPSYYPKRGPLDSRLCPDKSIREQFNTLRVVDNEMYPAWFEIDGQKYELKIKKI